MAKEVDQRIVEMRFENEQFQRNIRKTIQSLDNLSDKLEMETASRGFDMLQKTVDKFDWGNFSLGLDMVAEKFNSWAYLIENRLKTKVIDKVGGWLKSLAYNMSDLGQASSGLSKYAEKMESVMTIMNSTGLSMEKVNEYLDELMTYSDETSYSFTEMAKALGTFTSTGADIKDAIPMIEGIANATAHAGKGAAAFSSALLNLSQSYSAGSIQTIDWKSLSNYNIDTQALKQTFIDSAIALGQLNSEAKTSKGTLVTIETFKNTLNEKWATKEVITEAFRRYSEMFTEARKLVKSGDAKNVTEAMEKLQDSFDGVAKDSLNAAQNTKSFKESIEATKDAVSSGWLRTWEIIFGDFKEAKEMWTDLTDRLYDMFAAGADARNAFFELWRAWDGRENMIRAFQNVWDSLAETLDRFKSMLKNLFPKVTGENLAKLTKKVADFTEKLKYTKTTIVGIWQFTDKETDFAKKMTIIFQALESVLGIVIDFMSELWTQTKRVLTSLKPLFNSTSDFVFDMMKRIGLARDDLKGSGVFSKVLGTIADVIIWFVKTLTPYIQHGFASLTIWVDDVVSATKRLGNLVFFDSIKQVGSNTIQLFVTLFKSFFGTLIDFFNDIKDMKISEIMAMGSEELSKIGGYLTQFGAWVAETFSGFLDALINFVNKPIVAATLAVTALVVAMVFISSRTVTIFKIFRKIVNIFKKFDVFVEEVRRYFRAINIGAVVLGIIGIVSGLTLIASSISLLAKTYKENNAGYWAAILSIGGILVAIAGLFLVVKWVGKGAGAELSGFGMLALGIGVAVNFIATALLNLAQYDDPEGMKRATRTVTHIIGVITIIAGITAFLTRGWQTKSFNSLGLMFLELAIATRIIVKSIKILSAMWENDELGAGAAILGGITVLLLILVAFITQLSKDGEELKGAGKMFTGFAVAIISIVASIRWMYKIISDAVEDCQVPQLLLAVGIIVALMAAIGVLMSALVTTANKNTQYIGKLTGPLLALSVLMITIVGVIAALSLAIEKFGVWKVLGAVTSISLIFMALGGMFGLILGLGKNKTPLAAENNLKGMATALLALSVLMAVLMTSVATITVMSSLFGWGNVVIAFVAIADILAVVLGLFAVIGKTELGDTGEKLRERFSGLALAFVSLAVLMKIISKSIIDLTSVAKTNGLGTVFTVMSLLTVIIGTIILGIAQVISSVEKNNVSDIKLYEIGKIMTAMTVMVGIIGLTLIAMSYLVKDNSNILAIGGAFFAVVAGVFLMILGVYKIAEKMKGGELKKMYGLVGVATILSLIVGAILVVLSKFVDGEGLMQKVEAFAAIVVVLVGAIWALSQITSNPKVAIGLGVVCALLLSIAAPIASVALAIWAISKAIEAFSNMLISFNNQRSWKGLEELFNLLISKIPALVLSTFSSISIGFAAMVTSISASALAGVASLEAIFMTGIVSITKGIIKGAYKAIRILEKNIGPLAYRVGNVIGTGLLQGLLGFLSSGKLGQFFLKVFKLDESMEQIGEYAAQGLAKGLADDDSIEKAIDELTDNMDKQTRENLSIESPSKVFAAIGGFVSSGLAKGIEKNADEVTDSMGKVVGDMIKVAEETELIPIPQIAIPWALDSDGNPLDIVAPKNKEVGVDISANLNDVRDLAALAALSVKDSIGINIHHTFGTLVVQGVNDHQTLMETIEISVEDILGKIVRKQGRM